MGIVIFSILTVILNIILLCCYIRGQRAAKKTKRAIAQSHTNPAASNIIASEQNSSTTVASTKQSDVEKQELPSSSSASTGTKTKTATISQSVEVK
jgi:hypothetical protein